LITRKRNSLATLRNSLGDQVTPTKAESGREDETGEAYTTRTIEKSFNRRGAKLRKGGKAKILGDTMNQEVKN